jgi:ABC-type sulfate/molybdate transport systems ATPase subunit
MKAALIVMTIMGCDDSATQCHYIDTANQSWQTVALCDAQAETYINQHQNKNYPVIVAVCESSGDRMTVEVTEAGPEQAPAQTALPAPVQTPEEKQGLAARALSFVRKAIPDAASLKAAVTTPVRYAEDGYSWVVKRFAD